MSTGLAFTDTTFSGHVSDMPKHMSESDMPKHMSDYFTFYSDKSRTLYDTSGTLLGHDKHTIGGQNAYFQT